MAKIRVHELAKELGLPSKEMVDTLHKLGLDVKNHMSTMEESQAVWVRKRLKETQPAESDKAATKPAGAPARPTPQPPARAERASSASGQEAVRGAAGTNKERPATSPEQRKTDSTAPASTGMRQPERKAETTRMGSEVRPVAGRPERRPEPQRPGPAPSGGQAPRPQQPRPGIGPKPGPTPPAGGQRPGQITPGGGQRPGQHPPAGGQRPRPMGGQDSRPMPPRQPGGPRPTSSPPPRTGEQRPAAPGRVPPPRPVGGQTQKPFEKKPGQGFTPGPRPVGAGPEGVKKPGYVAGQGKPGKKAAPVKPQFTKDYSRPQKKGKHKKKKEEPILVTPEHILAGDSVQVRELAEKLGKGSAEIVKKLMELGIMATINQEIDYDTVEILASLYDVTVEREISEEQQILEEIVDSQESLVPRSPIVTVMGHVDHGKTSLLDKIRKADVVSGEAGGITQHIGAYQVTVSGNRITFIDTPGHEAFTAMRARGANLTDIVILVVAADDGVMPQTIEAINHIKAAKVPFIVALNKMDKPDVNPDKVMQQLTEYSIVPEQWGGETMFIPVSAKTGMGIDNLLEMVLLIAEMNDLKANPNRQAEGVVIEAQLDKGKGAVASLLVQKGTLKVGDCIVCGFTWCKVRAMTDYRGRKVDLAYPSMPVEITGWSDVPEVGERVQVCDEKVAKEIASLRLSEKKLEDQKQSSKISLDDFFKQMQNTGMKELNLIIKGDVQGSIEALSQSLLRLSTSEVKVNVIHSAVGAITETDVMLASASNAIIIGFNVRPDVKARKYGEDEKIDIRMYRVIYEAIDDVKKAMTGLLEPEYREKYLGRAEVRATFKVPNLGIIAGSYIIDGKLQRNASMRILRDSVIIYEGKLDSLKRFKDDVKEVMEGFECGIGV
ncbi:MAG: Translation initiation factor 2, partial [Chloroflexi bacterium]|nr:Translation initiation factor 2 [Chloroflexota bacterium]